MKKKNTKNRVVVQRYLTCYSLLASMCMCTLKHINKLENNCHLWQMVIIWASNSLLQYAFSHLTNIIGYIQSFIACY